MDLGALIQLADNAFEQVKKVSSLTEDANAIMGSVTGLAGQLGELKRAILVDEAQQLHNSYAGKESKKTPTERALEVYTAKTKIQQMEKELYHMFLYGDLNHLGMDGYKEFCKIREDMEKQASQNATEQLAYEIAEQADQDFMKQLKIATGAVFGSIVAVVELAQQIKDLFS
jgi:hypothetical protein